MSDKGAPNGYGTKEYVALKLYEIIAEKDHRETGARRDKNWVLDLYAECLETVNGYPRSKGT